MQALKYQATVGQDHKVVFLAPDLPDGTQLEIIALVQPDSQTARLDWAQKMGGLPTLQVTARCQRLHQKFARRP